MSERIQNIEIKMNLKVGLGDLDVNSDVFKQLKEIEENGLEASHEMRNADKYQDALNWLDMNVDSRDAYKWTYEVEELD